MIHYVSFLCVINLTSLVHSAVACDWSFFSSLGTMSGDTGIRGLPHNSVTCSCQQLMSLAGLYFKPLALCPLIVP